MQLTRFVARFIAESRSATKSRLDAETAAKLRAESERLGDLQRATPAQVQRAKALMEVGFEMTRVRPGDPDYVYDKRVEFKPTAEESNDWDEDEGAEEPPAPVTGGSVRAAVAGNGQLGAAGASTWTRATAALAPAATPSTAPAPEATNEDVVEDDIEEDFEEEDLGENSVERLETAGDGPKGEDGDLDDDYF